MGVEVRLLGTSLDGIATLLPDVLRLQVVCNRCNKPRDVESIGKGTEVRSAEVKCEVCKQDVGLRVAPALCHGGSTAIAHVQGMNCHPVQMLRSDFSVSCDGCTHSVRVNNIGPGFRKRAACPECHQKQNLMVEGVDLLGQNISHWRQVAADEGEKMNARRQLQDARRHERELGIKVGQPLPDQGKCRHYTKSFRWMRFPCCGRAFPCGDCHDEATDHPHEWANRMLCGHCSYEQPFSEDKCRNCGAASTRARSAYWEGGQGCRNRATMARNDRHKYQGLGKSVSNKAAAAKGGAK